MNYQDIKNTATANINKLKKISNQISILRLILFIAIVISLYFIIGYEYSLNPVLGLLVSVALFIAAINYHQVISKRIEYDEMLSEICERELIAIQNGINTHFNNGDAYKDSHHCFTYDLDIFGDKSVFQLLNRTFTLSGRNLLASQLKELFDDKNTLLLRQQAILELKDKTDWRVNFLTLGNLLQENNAQFNGLQTWLSQAADNSFEKFKNLVWLTPLLNTVLLLCWILGIINYQIFSVLFLLQLSFWGIYRKQINLLYGGIQQQASIIGRYNAIFQFIEKGNFQSELILYKQVVLKDIAGKIQPLTKIIRIFDLSKNPLGFPFFILFYGGLPCAYRFEKWKKENSQALLQAFDVLHELEVLVGIASFAAANPAYIIPEISEKTLLKSTKIGHPLITKEKRISNDFAVNEQFYIVTGANMAGKSTFLRSVGVNLVLAMIGSPVCAEQFVFKPLQLFTCMRVTDSISDGESYFHAELSRLSSIVHESEKGKDMFIILDELLKGTNSKDKLLGSELFIERLLQFTNTFGMIATHDLDLTNLATKYPQIKNICFEVIIENDKMLFDYQLKEGVTQNMNAIFLMKQMGIIS